MKNKILLLIDAIINFVLGIILLFFSQSVIDFLGLPQTDHYFYVNMLGAVIFGIALALLIEVFRKSDRFTGLGLAGAIAINMCGALVLALWLLTGNLEIPLKGEILLWSIVLLLIIISSFELLINIRNKKQ